MKNQIRAKDKISIGENLVVIPDDLLPEILKGLPAKTLVRFLCVSKQYSSIIRNQDFIKSYSFKSTQSLMFTFVSQDHKKRFFFSMNNPPNSGEPVSSSVATYHMQCDSHNTVAPSVHGLICYGTPYKFMLYNPSTRRSSPGLPRINSRRKDMYHYLGYDPINGDYKLLCMTKSTPNGTRYLGSLNEYSTNTRYPLAQEVRVLTMGNGNEWRMIRDFPPHSPSAPGICINGVLYYEAFLDTDPRYFRKPAVMSFDVRSEKFDLIKISPHGPHPTYSTMTSYEGKLAIMNSCSRSFSSVIKIYLWVLVDAAKHEWLEKVFDVPCWESEWRFKAFCITDAGEFVLAPLGTCEAPVGTCGESSRFIVLCYDWKKNVVRRVFIEGIKKQSIPNWNKNLNFPLVSIFPSQVESLMFL